MTIYRYRGFMITQPEKTKLVIRKNNYKAEIETDHIWTMNEMREFIDKHGHELEVTP